MVVLVIIRIELRIIMTSIIWGLIVLVGIVVVVLRIAGWLVGLIILGIVEGCSI